MSSQNSEETKAAIPLLCKAVTLSGSEPLLCALTQMAVLEAATALLRKGANENELRALGIADELAYFAAASGLATGATPDQVAPKAGDRTALVHERGGRRAA
jgi:hypothetical protein